MAPRFAIVVTDRHYLQDGSGLPLSKLSIEASFDAASVINSNSSYGRFETRFAGYNGF